MKRLEKAFDSIKTPDSWKENLYKTAYAETIQPKKFSLKRTITITFAAAAACMASALTVGALTGTFNIVEILRGGFSDEISAEKYIRGQYQELDVTCENENISFEAMAFMGDIDETYTLIAARPKTDMTFDSMAIEVSVLENTITNLDEYATFTINGIADTDEGGNPVYFFNVRNLPCCGLYEIGSESLIMRISEVRYIDGYNQTTEEVNLSMEIVPDITKLSQIEYQEYKEVVDINGIQCIVEDTHLSDYQASISFIYNVPNTLDIGGEVISEDYLIGDVKIRDILNLKSEYAYEPIAEECPIKLIVDGEIMQFIEHNEEAYHFPYENMLNDENISNEGTTFFCRLNFEPFTFSEAKSVAFEIETTDGETKIFKVK